MNKFYISLGQDHVHKIRGKMVGKDNLLLIEARDMERAREIAFEMLDSEWSMIYPEDKVSWNYFPGEVVQLWPMTF